MKLEIHEDPALVRSYYLNDRNCGRPGWHYPRFRVTERAAAGRPEVTAGENDLSQLAFAREAERQGVTSERLFQHALLYYLADLHSGRVARRTADGVG